MKQVNENYRKLKKALENTNAEYIEVLNSKEYRMGKRVYKILEIIKKVNIKELVFYLKSLIAQKKLGKCISDDYVKELFYSEGSCEVKFEDRIKIYSCITAGYDNLCEPMFKASNEEFVMYKDETVGVKESSWNFVDVKTLDIEDETININRYCKMHPFDLFSDADFSIYIDGNVQVVSDLNSLCNIARESVTGIAMHLHHARNCIYEEAKACEIAGRGNIVAIKNQIKKYEEEGFPRSFGMVEATIIVIDFNNPNARQIMEEWWRELLRSNSRRDQLAFPYVLWKLGFTVDDIGCLGNNLLRNPKFRIVDLGSHSFR